MKKKEIITVICILIIAFILLFIVNYGVKDKTYARVIDQKGQVLLRFDINKDAYYELDVPLGKYHIEVKDGHYHAIDVDCPNQTCVKQGWMPSFGIYTPIICLPNGIEIVIEE